jgi:hypothetical protein
VCLVSRWNEEDWNVEDWYEEDWNVEDWYEEDWYEVGSERRSLGPYSGYH